MAADEAFRYELTLWHHELDEEPVWFAYEIKGRNDVTRVIKKFMDGDLIRIVVAESDDIFEVPTPDEMQDFDYGDAEVSAFTIDHSSFEAYWAEAEDEKR